MSRFSGSYIILFAAALAVSTNALAQCDEPFFDPVAFAAAAPGLPTEDFEEGNNAGVVFDGPLNSTSDNAIFSPGDILPGLEISMSGFSNLDRLQLFDDTGFANMIGDGLSVTTGGQDVDGLTVTFNPAVSAFSISLFSESTQGGISLDVTTTQDVYEYGTSDEPDLSTGFFIGCISAEPVVSLQIDAPQGGSGNYEGIDNISFGEPQEPEPTYSVEGTHSGVSALGLVLQNNGADDIDIFTTNGNFSFPTQLADGSDYAVTVLTNPPGLSCIVGNGSGTIAGANVTDVTVTCSDEPAQTYTVGGTVSGLTGTGLELENMGADTLPIATDGPFTFATELEVGVSYVVSVSTQPTGQTCVVSDGSGTISNADIDDVAVTCTDNPEPLYTINGTVSGLGPNSVTLQNNGTDDLDVDANGTFVFATALPDGSPYDVTVLTQPTGQTCGVTNGFGTINGTDVLGVDVDCADDVVAPPPNPIEPIPTLSEWALILLTMLIGLMVFSNRRRLF